MKPCHAAKFARKPELDKVDREKINLETKDTDHSTFLIQKVQLALALAPGDIGRTGFLVLPWGIVCWFQNIRETRVNLFVKPVNIAY